jgi:hypothetical protein
MKNKNENKICTECLYVGVPSLSILRLWVEFVINFFLSSTGINIFEKVRHCPKCGQHSMVPLESEGGRTALSELEKKNLENHERGLGGGRT